MSKKEKKKFNILIVASECVPFAKSGGLADVAGDLAVVLKKRGHDVRVVMPKYSFIDVYKYAINPVFDSMGVWMGTNMEWCKVHGTTYKDVPVYFIEFHLYFDRNGLYHDEFFHDYPDNPKRFGFLSRASLQLCKDLNFKPDIVHGNDWQTALTAAYLKIWHWDDPVLGNAASVLTIHNLTHQGIYPKEDYAYLGLQEWNFTEEKFECFKRINFLKGGIYYADMVNTVSPTYAKETLTPIGGYGAAPYLNNKGDRYTGILNGADYDHWNPEKDPMIPCKYSNKDLTGKKICKKELQKKFYLEVDENIPVIGVISRFVEQKGLHLLTECLERIVRDMRVQFVILGTGDPGLESYFRWIPSQYGGKIGSYVGYDNYLAHEIIAGSDFFLMPSLFEPCGLTQIYSLKYGTLPIVRATGGLEDTVKNYNESTGEGTGFKFYDASSNAVYFTIGWAVSTYYDRKHHMEKLIQNAMKEHFSWEDSAIQYEKLYQRAIENKHRI